MKITFYGDEVISDFQIVRILDKIRYVANNFSSLYAWLENWGALKSISNFDLVLKHRLINYKETPF